MNLAFSLSPLNKLQAEALRTAKAIIRIEAKIYFFILIFFGLKRHSAPYLKINFSVYCLLKGAEYVKQSAKLLHII